MDLLTLKVSEREVGNLPLSIGTSFALELFTDREDPDKPGSQLPKPIPPDQVWINLKTLFRNLYNGVDSELRKRVLPTHLAPVLINEMEFILTFVKEQTLGKAEVVFYNCTYSDLDRYYPKANFKTANTDLQKSYAALEESTTRMIVDQYAEHFKIQTFKTKIEGVPQKVWLMTHVPVDLLSTNRFIKVTLLESHTGKLKEKLDWNSKLTNGKELTNMPFNNLTIQVFGDGSLFFSPMPMAVKKEILAIAEKYRWTPATTMDKIRYGIQSINDHFGRDILLGMAR